LALSIKYIISISIALPYIVNAAPPNDNNSHTH